LFPPRAYGQLLEEDVISVENILGAQSDALYRKRIVIFGGTGFLGTWLSTTLGFLNQRKGLSIEIKIVTRNQKEARRRFPNLNLGGIEFTEWDLRDPHTIELDEFDIAINGPTPSTIRGLGGERELTHCPSRSAAEAIAKSALKYQNQPLVINLSSGAVYKKSRSVDRALKESDPLLDEGGTVYEKDKLISESYLRKCELDDLVVLTNLRLFAFFGPLLPINEHFAIGNFLQYALSNRPIIMSGNASTKRSYLYPVDFVTIVLRFASIKLSGNFNVGGSKVVTMYELAEQIGRAINGTIREFKSNQSELPNFYFPNTNVLIETIGRFETITLEEGLVRWINWHRHFSG